MTTPINRTNPHRHWFDTHGVCECGRVSDALGDGGRDHATTPLQTGPWRRVLGFLPRTRPTVEKIQTAYRALARVHHPDRPTGSHESMTILNVARDAAIAAMD